MAKLSTYQKLKQHNQILENELRVLVSQPDSIEARKIKVKYKILIGIENQIMSGDSSKQPDEIEGMLNMVQC